MQFDLPDDIINTNNALWLLFVVNKCCLTDDPAVATVASQESIWCCFCLTFVDYCSHGIDKQKRERDKYRLEKNWK